MKTRLVLPAFLATWMCLSASLPASEVRLAITPLVSGPKDTPAYAEDTVNYYGTNIAILVSGFLRERAETQFGKKVSSSLRIEAKRIPNTSSISVTASGADESISTPFLSALIDQFLRFKREQKEKSYRDAIATVDTAIASAPADCISQLKAYRSQLVIASLVDVKPSFERVEY